MAMTEDEWEHVESHVSEERRSRHRQLYMIVFLAGLFVGALLWLAFTVRGSLEASRATALLIFAILTNACIVCAFRLIACIQQMFPLQRAIRRKNEKDTNARLKLLHCPIKFDAKIISSAIGHARPRKSNGTNDDE
jgi:hypothetical protein